VLLSFYNGNQTAWSVNAARLHPFWSYTELAKRLPTQVAG